MSIAEQGIITGSLVTVTDRAIGKIREISPSAMLRVMVRGGGCSGFRYYFDIDDPRNPSKQKRYDEDDSDFDIIGDFDDDDIDDFQDNDDDSGDSDDESDGEVFCDGKGNPVVLIDKKSLELLAGSVIDYVDDLNNCGFVIKNPNARSSCGCGTSFSL